MSPVDLQCTIFLINNGHRAIKVHVNRVQYCRAGHISLFYSTMTLISPVMALRLYILHVKLNKCLCHPVDSRALNSLRSKPSHLSIWPFAYKGVEMGMPFSHTKGG